MATEKNISFKLKEQYQLNRFLQKINRFLKSSKYHSFYITKKHNRLYFLKTGGSIVARFEPDNCIFFRGVHGRNVYHFLVDGLPEYKEYFKTGKLPEFKKKTTLNTKKKRKIEF